MKKRVFSILTVLCLCLTLLPGMALATEGETEQITVQANGAIETGEELQAALNEGGTVTLTQDITLTDTLTITKTVTLDLNGKTLTGSGSESVIKIESGGSLTLTDSVGTGKITNAAITGNGGGVYVDGGTFAMSGGTFEGEVSNYATIENGTFEAEVSNGTSDSAAMLGTISNGTFNGNVDNNLGSKISGGTFNKTGKVTNTNGTIAGGTFNGQVINRSINNGGSVADGGIIAGGEFYGLVTNQSAPGTPTNNVISSGTFHGNMTNSGKITGGTFEGTVENNEEGKIEGGDFKDVENNGTITGGNFAGEISGSGNVNFGDSGKTLYTVKFTVDGEDYDKRCVTNTGSKISQPSDPAKPGYRFAGWYNGDAKWDFDTPVTENLTLTAKWEKIHASAPSAPRYDVTVTDGAHGSVTVSPKNASKGSTVTITITPDSGYVLETISVTDKNGNDLKLTDKGNGKYTFTMPGSKVEVKATFMEDNSVLNFFYDVSNDAYYYEAVKWAVENGITGGIGNSLFAPNQPCTRAQIVTFLWRAAGSPVANYLMPFTDVDESAYYAEAARWAASCGIVTGLTETTFGTNDVCTRAQTAAMIYRYAQAQGKGFTGAWMFLLPFTDVPEWAYESVAWCYMNGVTTGVSETAFAPGNDCTRAQIVTFLWRAFSK